MYIGTALFFCLPLLPFFESTEFSPSTLFWSVVLGGVLVVPLLYLCIKNVPNSLVESASSNLNCNVRKPKIKDVWHIIWGNQPFLVFLSAFFLAGVGAGMSLGILFIFVDVYLGLGHKLSLAYLLSYGVSILAVGLWYKLANSLGKNVSWGVGMLLVVLGHLGMGFISPGESGWLPLLVCMIFIYGGMTSSVTLAPSILSDIIDFGIWKFGQDYAATYFSVYTLVLKANVGIGTALGLAVAGVYGFVPSIGIQTERAIFGLQLSIAWLPALIATVSIAFIALTPINQRRHKIIRRRVALKLDRAKSKYLREGDPQNKGVGPSSNLNAI